MKTTALITGATSGLGYSYAKFFAAQGCDLIITGRREQIIRENADILQNQYHVSVEVMIGDLSTLEGIETLMRQLQNRQIDILVNNAGFGSKPMFADTSPEDIEKMLYLHVWCVTKLTHMVLQGMVARDRGTIINISSDGAFAVMPHNVLYSSTKLYILNFTEGLHIELADTNILVQAVCPGFIDSHFHENAGMDMDKRKTGFLGFRKPDDIVADAMRDLKKGKTISIPDFGAKTIRTVVKFLPRRSYYKMIAAFSRKMLKKKSCSKTG